VHTTVGAITMLVDVADGRASMVIAPTVVCTSDHKAFYEREELVKAGDGDSVTKWCVEHHGRPVVWELRLPEAHVVNRYTFTSAQDVPGRDPSTWEISGSNDGASWTALDRHENESPFSKRGETKNYVCNNAKPFRLYRLTFEPSKGVAHFQVAEITIPGVTAAVGKEALNVQDYRRSLDLATATHNVSYRSGGVTYRREAFASHADGVMVLRFSADKLSSCSGVVRLQGAHKETTAATGNSLCCFGTLDNGLKYETKLLALNDGGTVSAADGKLEFKNCDSLTLLVAAGTDYVADYGRKYRGDDPHAAIEKRLAVAAKKKYEALKTAHVADFQSFFNRVSLDLGATPADKLALPVDQRKVLHAEQSGDPDLEELLFQYGRYLLISCSRPGGLPANLQGLWNDSNKPPWHSDYHANINIQMNYWLAEPANLAECHTTLFDLITSQLEPWCKATAAEKRFATASGKSRGWAVRTSHGIHGDIGWQWDVPANAWYCQHFWWHYAFGGDKRWLKRVAYPVMKETCEFWEDRLKALPDGRLVVPNGWSPEHGPHEDGVSYCQQIVWDLFNNYAAASEALGVDAAYRAKIAAMRDKLVGPKTGSWGQLQEWMTDRDDPNDHHRHTSHLFAVFPGQQISIVKTPEFAAAAKKSLVARGEDVKSDVRVVVRVAHGALRALARRRERAPAVPAVVLESQHLPEPIWFASADADRRQLRHYRWRLRDAAAISRRRDQSAARAAEGVAERQRQGFARPWRVRGGHGVEGRQASLRDRSQWRWRRVQGALRSKGDDRAARGEEVQAVRLGVGIGVSQVRVAQTSNGCRLKPGLRTLAFLRARVPGLESRLQPVRALGHASLE